MVCEEVASCPDRISPCPVACPRSGRSTQAVLDPYLAGRSARVGVKPHVVDVGDLVILPPGRVAGVRAERVPLARGEVEHLERRPAAVRDAIHDIPVLQRNGSIGENSAPPRHNRRRSGARTKRHGTPRLDTPSRVRGRRHMSRGRERPTHCGAPVDAAAPSRKHDRQPSHDGPPHRATTSNTPTISTSSSPIHPYIA